MQNNLVVQRCVASVGAALILTLAGCATEPSLLEENFGESVRQMRMAQVAFPEEDANPSDELPRVLDGKYGEAVLGAHRGAIGSTETVSEDIKLEVGE